MFIAQKNVFAPRLLAVAKGRELQLGPIAKIMGILNVTPDSFSDGGLDAGVDAAVERARAMAAEGADIIDIGGESTRPGADPVTALEEQRRVLPIIEALAGEEGGPLISIDTYRAETARLALEAGAHMVNDVWGLQYEPMIASVAADFGAGVCVMHTGRDRERLADPIADQFAWFTRSLDIARKAGIEAHSLMLDPGFGFAKEELDDNLSLIGRFGELHGLGLPLLAGTSRKRFVGTMTGRDAADRDAGTAATSVMLRLAGAGVFRVHNVAINRDALAVADAMVQWSLSQDHAHG